MPYIAPEERPNYEEHLTALAAALREGTIDPSKRAGHLNYVVTRLIMDT